MMLTLDSCLYAILCLRIADKRKNQRARTRAWEARNKERAKKSQALRGRRYYEANRENVIAAASEWNSKNVEARRPRNTKWAAKRRASDIAFRIGTVLRGRITGALKRNPKNPQKAFKTISLLGCSILEFKAHLEKQFLVGMTWKNWGNGSDCWNVDHIRPIASFDLMDPAQQCEAFRFTNCQPLWKPDNLSKGDKYVRG